MSRHNRCIRPYSKFTRGPSTAAAAARCSSLFLVRLAGGALGIRDVSPRGCPVRLGDWHDWYMTGFSGALYPRASGLEFGHSSDRFEPSLVGLRLVAGLCWRRVEPGDALLPACWRILRHTTGVLVCSHVLSHPTLASCDDRSPRPRSLGSLTKWWLDLKTKCAKPGPTQAG